MHHLPAPGQAPRRRAHPGRRDPAQLRARWPSSSSAARSPASAKPWSRAWPRAPAPSSRICSALYKDKVITLEEALANSDSPTNLSWLINNAQFGNGDADKAAKPASGIDFETTNPDGSSFSEFTLELDND